MTARQLAGGERVPSDFAAESVGLELVYSLRRLGVLHEFVREGLEWIEAEQRRIVAEVRADKAAKKGRAK